MTSKRRPYLQTLLGLFLALGSILTINFLDRNTANSQLVSFIAPTGDHLAGTFYPGKQPFGVLLLEGFGSDQVTMTSLTSEFSRNGWHVFTFDFSGHGRSLGALDFDNAQTDRLAHQAIAALSEFKRLSGLPAEQIFVLGHSLGARVALQSATMNPEHIAGLILLGTQVNLSTNVQSEFFTGTTDLDLPWVQALSQENPPVPIFMISGEWDDILPPEDAELLFSKLSGERYEQADGIYRSEIETLGTVAMREQIIQPFVIHNYEPFSGQVFTSIGEWLERRTGANFVVSPVPSIRVLVWIFSLIGIFLMLIGGEKWLNLGQAVKQDQTSITITNLNRFLWGKLLLWFGALPLAALLGGLFFSIPLPKPVFNLIYVGFIGGYGLLLLLLYNREKMPGVQGRLGNTGARSLNFSVVITRLKMNWKRILAAVGIIAGILLLTAAYARTGWFFVFPLNLRFAWLLIFTPFTALGFWIGLQEARMLPQGRSVHTVHTLISLFPFLLYTFLMAVLGSLSGMIGGIQGLIILWLVVTFGRLLQAVGWQSWLTAIIMSVLLYWLILPQGVLF